MVTNQRTNQFLNDDDWDVLVRVCSGVGVDPKIVESMIAAENRVYGMGRRHGILESLEGLIAVAERIPGPKGVVR